MCLQRNCKESYTGRKQKKRSASRKGQGGDLDRIVDRPLSDLVIEIDHGQIIAILKTVQRNLL
jgi:hypothetical protein